MTSNSLIKVSSFEVQFTVRINSRGNVNTSNRDRIPLSDIVSTGDKISGSEKNSDTKVPHVEEFSGRFKTFSNLTDMRMSAQLIQILLMFTY